MSRHLRRKDSAILFGVEPLGVDEKQSRDSHVSCVESDEMFWIFVPTMAAFATLAARRTSETRRRGREKRRDGRPCMSGMSVGVHNSVSKSSLDYRMTAA